MTLDYIYETEKELGQFVKLPLALFRREELKGLSVEGKLLYSFLLDRVSLSRLHGWKDEKGRFYVCYTVEEAVALLGKSRSTVLRLFQELEGKLSLITRRKRGQGKADLIYVKQWQALEVEEKEENLEGKLPHEEGQKEEKLEENFSRNCGGILPDYLGGTEKILPHEEGKREKILPSFPCGKLPEIGALMSNLDSLPSQLDTPRSLNLKPLEVSELDPIKTNQSQTDVPDSLPPSNPSTEEISPRERERVTLTQVQGFVLGELEQAYGRGEKAMEDLFYGYLDKPVSMKALVYHLAEFFGKEREAKKYMDYSKEMLYFSAEKLYCEALTQLLLEKKFTLVKGACVSYAKVVERLVPYVQRQGEGAEVLSISAVMGNTVGDFLEASKGNGIKHPIAYMKSCIWSTLEEGIVKRELAFQRMSERNWQMD